MKFIRTRSDFQSIALLAIGLLLFSSATLSTFGNPSGGSVIHGSATFNHDGNTLTINQGTDQLILGWNSFSISAGETTRFNQPNSSSMALNRVYGGTTSLINGNLVANGKVILINPDGITIGKSGVVNVNSFIGSTRDISDSEFLSGGPMSFKGTSSASFVNLGTINADSGDVIVIAHKISNEGRLSAKKGTVGLAAADEVLYQPAAGEKLLIQSKGAAGGSLHQGGVISAAAAEIKAAGNPYAVAINLDGVIEIHGKTAEAFPPKVTVQSTKGDIRIGNSAHVNAPGGFVTVQTVGSLEIGGTLLATSSAGHGGEIRLLGEKIHLDSTAVVDTSGFLGGGKIFVGGDYQGGQNPSLHYASSPLQTAKSLEVDQGAKLSADALNKGNGGTIVQWSDNETVSGATVSVRGGPSGGNGGFAEISGKQNLGFSGSVDLKSPIGTSGTVLFDPSTLYIHDGNNSADSSIPPSDLTGGQNNSWLSTGVINAITTGTVQLIADTVIFNDGHGLNPGNILLQPNVNLQITATTGGLSIPLGSSITAQGSGFVQLYASRDLSVGGSIQTDLGSIGLHSGNGNINFSSGSSIQQSKGGIQIWTDNGSVLGSSQISSVFGSINLSANKYQSGNIDFSGSINTGTGGLLGNQGGSITLNAANNIIVNGTISSIGSAISFNAANSMTFGNTDPTGISTANNNINLTAHSISLNSTLFNSADGGVSISTGSQMILASDSLATVGTSLGSLFNNLHAQNVTLYAGTVYLSDPNGGNPTSVTLPQNESIYILATAGNLLIPTDSTITASGNGSVQLYASQGLNLGGKIQTDQGYIGIHSGMGNVDLSSGSSIQQNNGGIQIWSDNGSLHGSSMISSVAGWVNMSTYGNQLGSIDFTGTIKTGANGLNGNPGGSISLNSANNITLNGIISSIDNSIYLNAASSITLGSISALPSTEISTAGGLQLNAPQLTFDNTPILSVGSLFGTFGTINPSSIQSTSSDPLSKIYDGTTSVALPSQNFSFTGMNNGYSASALSINGTYNSPDVQSANIITINPILLSVSGPNSLMMGNFSLNVLNFSVPGVITPATLTASLTGTISKTYDATTTAQLSPSNYLLSGLLGHDLISLNNPTSGAFDTHNVGTGLNVSVQGLSLLNNDLGNYVLASSSISAPIGTITPATVTVQTTVTASLTGLTSKVYDATSIAFLSPANYLLNGVLGNDPVSINAPAYGTYDTPNTGVNKLVTVEGLSLLNNSLGNYILASTTISGSIGTITPAPVSVNLLGTTSKLYDTTTTATLAPANYILNGVLGNDLLGLNNPTLGTYDSPNAGGNKNVTINGLTLVGNNLGNYILNSPSVSGAIGTITPAPISVNLVGSTTKIYDTTAAAVVTSGNFSSLAGVLPGDHVSLNPVTSGSFADPNAGAGKLVTVSVGLNNANYQIVDGSGNVLTSVTAPIGTITPAPVSVNLVGSTTKVYDTTAAAVVTSGNFSSLAGVLPGDHVSLNPVTSGSFADPNAGAGKLVTVSVGLNNANYQIVDDSGNVITSISAPIGTITPAPVSVNLVGSTTKVYDTTAATVVTSGNFSSLAGVLPGDHVSLNPVTSGSFADPNAGAGKLVTVSVGLNNANYQIVDDSGNVITSISAPIGTITPAPVTSQLVGYAVKSYDATTSAALTSANFTSLGGVLPGDHISLIPGVATYDNPNVGTRKLVTVSVGLDNNNYQIVNAQGTVITSITALIGIVTPAAVQVIPNGGGAIEPITVSLVGSTAKVYDGTTLAILSSANFSTTGIIPGDSVALQPSLIGTYDNPNVGVKKTVTVNVSLNNANYEIVDDHGNVITSVSAPIGTITAAPVLLNLVGSTSKVYDTTATAVITSGNFSSLAGVLPGDHVTLNPVTSGSFADPNTGAGKLVTVSVGLNNANYQIVDGSGNVLTSVTAPIGTITPAPVSVNLVGSTSKVYDTTAAAVITSGNFSSLTGVLPGDQVALNPVTSGNFNNSNAGSGKLVTVSVGLNNANYQIVDGSGNVLTSVSAPIGTITPAPVSVNLVGSTTKVYDTTTASILTPANYLLSGILGSDNVTLNSPTLGTYNTANAESGKSVSVNGLSLSGVSAPNYQLLSTSINGSIGSITQATLIASLSGKSSKVYDTTTTASLSPVNYILSGILGNDQVTLNNPTSGTYATANAGSGKSVGVNGLSLLGSSAANYKLLSTSIAGAIGTITPATLTASLTGSISKTYDTTAAATLAPVNFTLSGVLGNDLVSLNNPNSGTYDTANAGSGKTVTVNGASISGVSVGNYRLLSSSINGAIGTITPATLTASLTGGVSKTYDTTTSATLAPNNYNLSGILGRDKVSLNDPTSGNYNTPNVGSAITVSVNGLSLYGSSSGNYTLQSTSINGEVGTITPAKLTAALTGSVSKTYDTTTTASLTPVNYILSGVLGNDLVNLNNPTSGIYATANAGSSKSISINGLSLYGSSAGNYTLQSTIINGPIGTITPATLTASLTGSVNKIYDTTTSATIIPANYTLNGILGNDKVVLNNPSSGTYDTFNSGTGINVSVNGLSLAGRSSGNYTLLSTSINGSVGTISPATLTASLSGNVSKTYDTTTSATLLPGNYILNGILGSDQVVLNNPISGNFVTANAGKSKTLSVSGLSISGNSAGNYTLLNSSINGTIGTITPATLSASLTGSVNKIYDTSAVATLAPANYTLNGILGNDKVVLNDPSSGTYNNVNAGTGITVSVRGLSLAGISAGNYTLLSTSINGPIGVIAPATLIASLTGKVSKIYDTTTSANLSSKNYLLSGILGNDQVSLNDPTSGTFNTPNVGKSKNVSVSGLSLSGSSAANYTLLNTTITGAIGKIIPATITAALTGSVTKVYDGTSKALLGTANYILRGILGNDQIALNNPTSGTYDSASAGDNKIVTVGGLALLGNINSNYKLISTTINGPVGSITQAQISQALQSLTSVNSSMANSSMGGGGGGDSSSSGSSDSSSSGSVASTSGSEDSSGSSTTASTTSSSGASSAGPNNASGSSAPNNPNSASSSPTLITSTSLNTGPQTGSSLHGYSHQGVGSISRSSISGGLHGLHGSRMGGNKPSSGRVASGGLHGSRMGGNKPSSVSGVASAGLHGTQGFHRGIISPSSLTTTSQQLNRMTQQPGSVEFEQLNPLSSQGSNDSGDSSSSESAVTASRSASSTSGSPSDLQPLNDLNAIMMAF